MSTATSTAFATADELSAYLGVSIDPARAGALLTAASDALRAACGQRLDKVSGDVITLDPDDRPGVVWLPQLPVTAVTGVELAQREGTWAALQPVEYDWWASGRVQVYAPARQGWPRRGRSIRITYDHGYDPPPPQLAELTVSVAGRAASTPLGVTSETVGAITLSYAGQAAAVTLTPDEQATLDDLVMARIG